MVESPCNKICTLNADHVCVGCGRSRAEIASWSQLSDTDKKRVSATAKQRLATMGAAKQPGNRVSA